MWTNTLDGQTDAKGFKGRKSVRFLNPFDDQQINIWEHLRNMQWSAGRSMQQILNSVQFSVGWKRVENRLRKNYTVVIGL